MLERDFFGAEGGVCRIVLEFGDELVAKDEVALAGGEVGGDNVVFAEG